MDHRKTPPFRISRRAALAGAAQAVAVLAAACAGLPAPRPPVEPSAGAPVRPTDTPAAPTQTPAPTPTGSTEPVALPTEGSGCLGRLSPVVAPTAIPYPGYTAAEPSTGLHVTAPPQILDVETYRLKVTGKVAHELSLTYDDLRCLPNIKAYAQVACPGFFIDWSNYAGASLVSVLDQAELLPDAKQILFRGVDGRSTTISVTDAQASQYFLAYEWEGEPLPRSHGFPVRAALLNNIGGYWIKWLQDIDVT